MDPARTVHPRGVVYIGGDIIAAVSSTGAPPPPGFETVVPVATGGTLYPGLIELHNHLAYNVLRLWAVPRRFDRREQWGGRAEYRRLISGPMQVLGSEAALMPAIVRYVECKALMGGTTTTQGIELFSNRGARRYYRGVVRNVEQTDDPELPEADAKIADVDAASASAFFARIQRPKKLILHLAEGVDDKARAHFLGLEVEPGKWALSPSLVGIHSAALTPADFDVMADHGAAMVWSPLSNLLLYGATADVAAAKAAGVRIGLGSDWSPSGSKNLLGELKVASVVNRSVGSVFTDAELVAMATCDAAEVLGWRVLGSLAPGKRADLIVVSGQTADPYRGLLEAAETAIRLVMIAGVARYGSPAVMRALVGGGERVQVGGRLRMLNFAHPGGDPDVGELTLAQARRRLRQALAHLPKLARAQEQASPDALAEATSEPEWRLALDELVPTGMELRPRLAQAGLVGSAGPAPELSAELAAPLSTILEPLDLDAASVADDKAFLELLQRQPNLPPDLAAGVAGLYDD